MSTKTAKPKATKKPPLKAGNSNGAPTQEDWTEEARKIAQPEPSKNGKPEEHEPKPIGEDVQKVVNRVKGKLNGPHVSEGDWQAQRREDLTEIVEKRTAALSNENQLKANYNAAKKTREALDGELITASRDINKPYPPRPAALYPDPDKGKKKGEPSANGKPAAPLDDTDESWKTVPLASLNLPKGLLEKLASPMHKDRGAVQPIKTIGDVMEFLKPKNGWEPRLVDIKGVGAGAVDKLDAALDEFWKSRKAEPTPKAETKPAATETKPKESETKADAPQATKA